MRTLNAVALGLVVCVGLAGCGGAEQPSPATASCPTQEEAQAALTSYIETTYWSPGEREIWKIASVDGYTFTTMIVGNIVQKQVEYGQMAQDVCPVRITYSFTVHRQDGSTETTSMGEGKTHLFYRNAFNEWIFKTE